jgi:hypothetical protein
VPIEQLSEACRLRQRRGDQFGIVRCWLPLSGDVTRSMTVAAVGVAPTPFRLRLARPNESGPRPWPVPTDQKRPEGRAARNSFQHARDSPDDVAHNSGRGLAASFEDGQQPPVWRGACRRVVISRCHSTTRHATQQDGIR